MVELAKGAEKRAVYHGQFASCIFDTLVPNLGLFQHPDTRALRQGHSSKEGETGADPASRHVKVVSLAAGWIMHEVENEAHRGSR